MNKHPELIEAPLSTEQLAARYREMVWIVRLKSARCGLFGKDGAISRSRHPVDLGHLFDSPPAA